MQNLDEMVDPSRLEAGRALFAEQGFVLVPDLVPTAEIERYGQAIDEAVDARSRPSRRQGRLRPLVPH